jgi:MFS family permease
MTEENKKTTIKDLPRNIWAVSLTSFFTDVSTEMVINLIPLFLANILGIRTSIIGLIEGVAESTASILSLFSGWLSDKLKTRKWLAVAGYGISTLAKPFYFFANSWQWVAGVRWADRIGKGIRTAPRDALVADSISNEQRGLAFGFHRAADTGGAMVGLLIAFGLVWAAQSSAVALGIGTFRLIVLVSLVPALLGVIALAIGVVDVRAKESARPPKFAFKSLGKQFMIFMLIVGLFDLGNSSDAFLVLRAQERGVSVLGILGMLAVFNLVYSLVSTPAGRLSDRIDRRKVIIGGWTIYAFVYLGFGLVNAAWQVWALYVIYGLYYGMAYGTAKAMLADLVPVELRGTAYGTYNAVLGILDLPASLIAGILWQGVGGWQGFGPAAPFLFGALLAGSAAVMMAMWKPVTSSQLSH